MERRGESKGRVVGAVFGKCQSGNAMEAVGSVVEGRDLASHDSREDRGVEGDSVNVWAVQDEKNQRTGMVLCSAVSAAVRDGTTQSEGKRLHGIKP
ncbi:hypothetical protein ERJ75_001400000 [Trypanosoma vivax]|nr:hypothetical protein ERJ75_001400000 [Trypanosoma vivax]